MRGLSLTQPWASLVAIGAKRIETRSWRHPYRGPVAIHAALKVPEYASNFCDTREVQEEFERAGAEGFTHAKDLPLGMIVAVADIETMFRFTSATFDKILERSRAGGLPKYEALFGDYSAGRCGILLTNVRELASPVPCRGALSLWEIPGDVQRQILEQLTHETANA